MRLTDFGSAEVLAAAGIVVAVECAPDAGHGQAAFLTGVRALRSSNALVPPSRRDVLALAERGDLGGMSFGFSAVDEHRDGNRRELRGVTLH